MVKSIPDELFEELTEEVTGDKSTKLFTKAQAMIMISKITEITGLKETKEPKAIHDEDMKILNEFGF